MCAKRVNGLLPLLFRDVEKRGYFDQIVIVWYLRAPPPPPHIQTSKNYCGLFSKKSPPSK